MYQQKGPFKVSEKKKEIPRLEIRGRPPASVQGIKHHDINLVADYFKINLRGFNNYRLFQYPIGVEPETTKPRLRRRAIYCWLQRNPLGVKFTTNYHNFLVTTTRIPDRTDPQDFE